MGYNVVKTGDVFSVNDFDLKVWFIISRIELLERAGEPIYYLTRLHQPERGPVSKLEEMEVITLESNEDLKIRCHTIWKSNFEKIENIKFEESVSLDDADYTAVFDTPISEVMLSKLPEFFVKCSNAETYSKKIYRSLKSILLQTPR